jgi:uncharacterized protein YyaL (SSP411 family)
MSYDNSELLKTYLDAYALFADDEYADIARGIVGWVRNVLADPEGGYGASQDADVGLDDDGDYFTWTRDEAAAVLTPEELEVAAAYYDIGTAGEMHHNPGKNVLFISATVPGLAQRIQRTPESIQSLLGSAREKLLAARSQRTAPYIDRTRYTNWNAMMASAMLRAGTVLSDDWCRSHGLATLERIRREGGAADAVTHTPGGIGGLLDDQVQTAAAALDAYELTGGREWLQWSESIMDRVWSEYWDGDAGGLFDTARGRLGEEGLLPARAKPVQDTPTPSPNGVAGVVCVRLHELTGDARWKQRAEEVVRAFAGSARELGLYAATYLLAVDWYINPSTHLVVVGDPNDAAVRTMHQAALRGFVPRRAVQLLVPDEAANRPLPPALTGMMVAGQAPRGYACTGNSCSQPAEDPSAWEATLEALKPTATA